MGADKFIYKLNKSSINLLEKCLAPIIIGTRRRNNSTKLHVKTGPQIFFNINKISPTDEDFSDVAPIVMFVPFKPFVLSRIA